MGIVYFGNRQSSDFGLVVEKCPDYQIAQRRVEKIAVEGRNGDLLRDTGTYNNVPQIYSVYYNAKETSFQEEAHKISAWLGSYGAKGYQDLSDDYDGITFRRAIFSGMTNFKNWLNDFGRIDLTFDCMPERWLFDGQSLMDLEDGMIPNDFMACHPILAVTGNGTVNYGNTVITVTDNTGITTCIDTETGDAYAGSIGVNDSYPLNFSKAGKMSSHPTGSWKVPMPATGLVDSHVYLNWWTSYGSPNTGLLSINKRTSASQVLTGTGWTISHNALDDFITVSCDSNDINPTPPLYAAMQITGSLSALLNRNANVTIDGSLEAVPNGGLAVTVSGPTFQYIPRWWTL